MAELSAAFLDMAEEAAGAVGRYLSTFATHVSHELKSPLTAIQGAAELLRDCGSAMDEAEARAILRQHRRRRRPAQPAGAPAASSWRAPKTRNLSDESTSLAEAVALLPADDRLTVAIADGADTRFRMSAEECGDRARQSASTIRPGMARRALLAFGGKRRTAASAVAAADDGDGISPSNRARIFEPFFTTRRDSGGTGMGLGIVLALLKAHDGTIRLVYFESGTRFSCRRPPARSDGVVDFRGDLANECERDVGEHQAPAVGRAFRITLVDADVVPRFSACHQVREEQSCRPSANDPDLHGFARASLNWETLRRICP